MDTLTLLGIAVGLAMDAFAVAIATGIVLGTVSGWQTFRLAFHFGLFQFLMPVVGYLAGMTVERYIAEYDHWLAFALLVYIGGKMVHEGFRGEGEEGNGGKDPTRGMSLVVLSVATSIDALAVGVSLGVLHNEGIVYPGVVIGVVACTFTAAGLHLGKRLGAVFGKRMEIVGGVVLVAIGVKILLDHYRG
ncbi:manganese efflux pump MntP family protein [bacterium]|nr:manganese efflux pump MntP family protein [bacterium]